MAKAQKPQTNTNPGWDTTYDTSTMDLETNYELLAEGDYDFRVKTFTRAISKKGQNMAKIELEVEGHKIIDYFVLSNETKIAKFFISLMMIKKGDTFSLSMFDGVVGMVGLCHVGIDHDDTGKYHDRNTIKWYIAPEEAEEDSDIEIE